MDQTCTTDAGIRSPTSGYVFEVGGQSSQGLVYLNGTKYVCTQYMMFLVSGPNLYSGYDTSTLHLGSKI